MADNFKETSLKGHIQLCELRYQALEERLDAVETRLNKIEEKVSSLKDQTQSGFTEIKLLLERDNNRRQTQMTATFGSVAVAIISVIGYIISQ
jgi:hypothetical protein